MITRPLLIKRSGENGGEIATPIPGHPDWIVIDPPSIAWAFGVNQLPDFRYKFFTDPIDPPEEIPIAVTPPWEWLYKYDYLGAGDHPISNAGFSITPDVVGYPGDFSATVTYPEGDEYRGINVVVRWSGGNWIEKTYTDGQLSGFTPRYIWWIQRFDAPLAVISEVARDDDEYEFHAIGAIYQYPEAEETDPIVQFNYNFAGTIVSTTDVSRTHTAAEVEASLPFMMGTRYWYYRASPITHEMPESGEVKVQTVTALGLRSPWATTPFLPEESGDTLSATSDHDNISYTAVKTNANLNILEMKTGAASTLIKSTFSEHDNPSLYQHENSSVHYLLARDKATSTSRLYKSEDYAETWSVMADSPFPLSTYKPPKGCPLHFEGHAQAAHKKSTDQIWFSRSTDGETWLAPVQAVSAAGLKGFDMYQEKESDRIVMIYQCTAGTKKRVLDDLSTSGSWSDL